MHRTLRALNIAATVVTLASGLSVLVQDLPVEGYRDYHRDWVAFVAAYCAVQAYQPGVMTLYPAGTPDTGTANWAVNGTLGQLQMLYMLVPLDSTGKFNIHNRFTDKQIYVDVWGYLIAP